MELKMESQHRILSIIIAGFTWLWVHILPFFIVGFGWLGFAVINIPSPVEHIADVVVLKYGIPLLATLISYLSNMNKVNHSVSVLYFKVRRLVKSIVK